jgi:non-ribosomal peptide synthetase-like protein
LGINNVLIQEAEERLKSLRGLDDVRHAVDLWKESRFCHFMFRARAHSDLSDSTCLEIWDKPQFLHSKATWAELNCYAERICTVIRAKVKETKNRPVCIYLPRSVELIASVIGVWYSGAAVCIIDSKLPLSRLEYVAKDCDAAMVISLDSLVGPTVDLGVSILNMDVFIGSVSNFASHNRDMSTDIKTDISDDDVCLIIYTSGSTGNPKGVRLQYGAFSNYAAIEQVLTIPSPSDRIIQTQTLSFIAGFHECWRALCSGAVLVMANSAITGLGPDLENWLRDQRITIMKAVPSLLRSMVQGDQYPNLPLLRVLHVGGEAVTQELVNRFGHNRLFLNSYGSTESCSNCLIGFCSPETICTIGKPLPTFEAFVFDTPENMQEVNIGELYVQGRSLALDYLNLPDITQAMFIQHPIHGRLYRTGDIVERLDSGNFVYVGRRDNQVKINGYRVELGEVECSMNKLPNIKEAAAIMVDDFLYAIVSPMDPNLTITLDGLKSGLKAVGLPFFAFPSRLEILAEFPKTISGKLDRKFLKQEIQRQNQIRLADMTECDESTRLGVIVASFKEILKMDIKPDDDFFSLGGDSVAAGQTVGLIRSKGKHIQLPNVSILDLYKFRTPNNLVENFKSMEEDNLDAHVSEESSMPLYDRPTPALFKLVSFIVAAIFMFFDGVEIFIYFWIIWHSGFAIPVTKIFEIDLPPFAEIFVLAGQLLLVKLAFYVFWIILAIVIKWTIIGRYTKGRWAKYGPMHLRHWVVLRATSHLPWRIIGGTGLGAHLMWVFGSKVGKGVFTCWEPSSGSNVSGFDLYELGDYSSICQGSYCSPIYFTHDSMVCGRISLGKFASIYPRATVSGSLKMGEGSVLDSLSCIQGRASIGPWEKWAGSPVRQIANVAKAENVYFHNYSSLKEQLFTIIQLVDVIFGYYLVLCVSMIPRYILLMVLIRLDMDHLSLSIFFCNVLLSIFFGCIALTVFAVLFVRTATYLSPSRPGKFDLFGFKSLVLWHILFWFKTPQLMLNNTRFLQWFSRACGMQLGKGSQISMVKGCIPDLVTIGNHTFLANPVFLGVPVVQNLQISVGRVTIGDNVLVGNNSCFFINSVVPSNSTIAVNTGAPPPGAEPGGVWLGYPANRITENKLEPYPKGKITDRISLFLADTLVLFIPGMFYALTILSWIFLFSYFALNIEHLKFNLMAATAVGALLTVPLRLVWAIVGGLFARYLFGGLKREADEKSAGFWDNLCYRWRIYNKVWAFYVILMLDEFTGSEWMNGLINFLTLAEIEKDVLIMHHGLFKDHNYVKIRRGATINEGCVLRTHTFEDWRLKFGFVEVGQNVTVRSSTTIMLGTTIGSGSIVMPNSLVLKHDTIAANTVVSGLPAVQISKVNDGASELTV